MNKRLRMRRRFLGRGTCMGAVAWTVSVRPVYGKNKHMMCMDGELSINDEAGNHYVDCRKDMVPLYKMQNELNRFIAECEEGFADLEAHNEGLKQYKEADE